MQPGPRVRPRTFAAQPSDAAPGPCAPPSSPTRRGPTDRPAAGSEGAGEPSGRPGRDRLAGRRRQGVAVGPRRRSGPSIVSPRRRATTTPTQVIGADAAGCWNVTAGHRTATLPTTRITGPCLAQLLHRCRELVADADHGQRVPRRWCVAFSSTSSYSATPDVAPWTTPPTLAAGADRPSARLDKLMAGATATRQPPAAQPPRSEREHLLTFLAGARRPGPHRLAR
jgi:hypothetical protein